MNECQNEPNPAANKPVVVWYADTRVCVCVRLFLCFHYTFMCIRLGLRMYIVVLDIQTHLTSAQY